MTVYVKENIYIVANNINQFMKKQEKILCLGIESTAHTFGASVVDSHGNVYSNVMDSYTTKKGGIIPAHSADHHVEVCGEVIKKALTDAKTDIKNINLISFSQGPGLGHCLMVGAMAARAMSIKYNIPIIGVNHCIAHLEIGKLLTTAKDPILLYVSGANTQVISFEGGRYRVMGESLDIGVGNFLDSFARYIGIGFPGGPMIEKLALKGKRYIELPYVVKGMDVSFGGLLTNLKNKYNSKKYTKEDLCYSLQETVFAMLLEVSERALAHCDKDELLLGGGVACNKRLREMADVMCRSRNAKCFVPLNQFLVDNAAMIAWLGILMYKSGTRMSIKDTKIMPYQRTDQVEVSFE